MSEALNVRHQIVDKCLVYYLSILIDFYWQKGILFNIDTVNSHNAYALAHLYLRATCRDLKQIRLTPLFKDKCFSYALQKMSSFGN